MEKRSRTESVTLDAFMASKEGTDAIDLLQLTEKKVVIKEGPGCMGKKEALEFRGDGLQRVVVDFGSKERGEFAESVSVEEMLRTARTFYDLTEADILARIREGIASIAATV